MNTAEIYRLHAVPVNGTVRTVHEADEHQTFIFGCAFDADGQILEQLFEYYGDRVALSGDLETAVSP